MGMRTITRGAAAVAAAAGLVGWAVAATPAQAARETGSYSITIGASAATQVVTGDVFVVYDDPPLDNSATISGSVSGDVPGDTVTLYQEPFGATSFVSTGMTEGLDGSGTDDPYSFSVQPSVETKYQVEVFTNTTLDITSGTQPVYVIGFVSGSYPAQPKCNRHVCSWPLHLKITVPSSAYQTESHKRWYMYSTVSYAKSSRRLHLARRLKLDGRTRYAYASKVHRINSGEFSITLHWIFKLRPGEDIAWATNACTRDAVTKDGLGLPGHHGCGDKYISRVHPPYYLGSPDNPGPRRLELMRFVTGQ